jgi:hypothetical protein
MTEQIWYQLQYGKITAYRVVKESAHFLTYIDTWRGKEDTRRVSKKGIFPSLAVMWEHEDAEARKSLQYAKDRVSDCQQRVSKAQQELARVKREAED